MSTYLLALLATLGVATTHSGAPPLAVGVWGGSAGVVGIAPDDEHMDLVELDAREDQEPYGWGRITKTYPGRTHALRLHDRTLLPIKWEVMGNVPGMEPVATVDADSGVAQFNRVGVAVFRIPMFVGKVKTVRFAIIEVIGQDMTLEFTPKKALLAGETAEGVTAVVFHEGEVNRQVQRPVTLTVENDQVVQLSADGTAFGKNVKTQPGETIRVRGGIEGKTKITMSAAGLSKSFDFEVMKPRLKLVSSSKKPTQGSTVTVTAQVVSAADKPILGYLFEGKLEQDGGMLGSTEANAISVLLEKQGDLKVSGKFAAKGIAGTDVAAELTLPIQPVVSSVLLDRFPTKMVVGDKIKLPIRMLDGQKKPVSRANRSGLDAVLMEQLPNQTWIQAPGVGVELIEDPDADFLRFSGAKIDKEYKLVIHTKSDGGALVTGSTGVVKFIPEVEVVASQVTSPQHARDLFGSQTARENLVYSITATNNLGAVEDDTLVKGGTVQLYGATLLMPVKIERKRSSAGGSGRLMHHELRSMGLGETPTDQEFKESSETEIARFAAGGDGPIYVLVPPLYAEVFGKVREAIDYRDPARVAQRFIANLNELAKVLYTGFPNAHSNPFRGEEDPKKRDLAMGLLGLFFTQYETQEGKKGKFGPERMLGENSEVSAEKPKVFYYLVPRDTWTQVEKAADIKVTFYPQCNVKVTYAKVVAAGKSQPSVTPTKPGGNVPR